MALHSPRIRRRRLFCASPRGAFKGGQHCGQLGPDESLGVDGAADVIDSIDADPEEDI
jgi:hypothetical protein